MCLFPSVVFGVFWGRKKPVPAPLCEVSGKRQQEGLREGLCPETLAPAPSACQVGAREPGGREAGTARRLGDRTRHRGNGQEEGTEEGRTDTHRGMASPGQGTGPERRPLSEREGGLCSELWAGQGDPERRTWGPWGAAHCSLPCSPPGARGRPRARPPPGAPPPPPPRPRGRPLSLRPLKR